MLKRLAIVTILALSIWTIAASIDTSNRLAFACSCSAGISVSEYVEKSSSTFVGTVQDVEANANGGYDVQFANVSRVWGEWANDFPYDGRVTVWTSSLGDGDCGYPFERGVEYLVYTQRDESSNTLWADLCNGTKPAEQAIESEFQMLGPGTNPMTSGGGVSILATHSGRILTVFDFILPAALGTGAVAVAWMFFRHKSTGKGGSQGPVFAGIAIGLAFVLTVSLTFGGYIDFGRLSEDVEARENEHLVCSTVSGFWSYHRAGIAESIEKDSDLMIVIGTITNAETRALEFYSSNSVFDPVSSTSEIVGYTPTGRKIPYKVIDFEVEKYLIDETGRYLDTITFRAPANACVDNRNGEIVPLPASFDSDPASDPDKSPKFNVGDRSLIEIHRWHGGEYREEGLDAESTVKLDIDENGYVKADARTGIARPVKIDDLEREILTEIEKLM